MTTKFELDQQTKTELQQAIRTQDWPAFMNIRYKYGQDGWVFIMEDLDLSHCQLGDIPSDFLCFKNCNLDNASFQGKQFWPTSLWSCSAKNIDLRHTHGFLLAKDCDLTGAKFDHSSELNPSHHTNLPSTFGNCQLDPDFQAFLKNQGCRLSMDDNTFKYGFLDTWPP